MLDGIEKEERRLGTCGKGGTRSNVPRETLSLEAKTENQKKECDDLAYVSLHERLILPNIADHLPLKKA